MRIQDVGERELISIIHRLQAQVPLGYVGIGDDAAYLPPNSSGTLISQDMLVENVHFRLDWTTAEQLGEKSVAVNISDIAAMGGQPMAMLTSLSVPGNLDVQWVEDLYRGIAKALDWYGAVLVGGDTVGSTDRIALDVTVLGRPGPTGPILRTGAKPGDRIFVTGRLGAAYAGYLLLSHGTTWPSTVVSERSVMMAHLSPVARIQMGLAMAPWAHAMTDVSDGLVMELEELTRFGSIGATIWQDALPIDAATRATAQRFGGDVVDFALFGGEDYELVATIPPSRVSEVLSLATRCGVAVTEVGIITESPGIRIAGTAGGEERVVHGHGFNHFSLA